MLLLAQDVAGGAQLLREFVQRYAGKLVSYKAGTKDLELHLRVLVLEKAVAPTPSRAITPSKGATPTRAGQSRGAASAAGTGRGRPGQGAHGSTPQKAQATATSKAATATKRKLEDPYPAAAGERS